MGESLLESLTGGSGETWGCPRAGGLAGQGRGLSSGTPAQTQEREIGTWRGTGARHERLEREVPTQAGGDSVLGLAGANRPPHALHSSMGCSHQPRLDSASASIVWTQGKVAVEYSEPFLKCCMFNTYSLAVQMVFFITFWKRDPRHLSPLFSTSGPWAVLWKARGSLCLHPPSRAPYFQPGARFCAEVGRVGWGGASWAGGRQLLPRHPATFCPGI